MIIYCILFAILGILSTIAVYWFSMENSIGKAESEHPLTNFFDRGFSANFNSPYLDISEVQEYCPCSAYEGS